MKSDLQKYSLTFNNVMATKDKCPPMLYGIGGYVFDLVCLIFT